MLNNYLRYIRKDYENILIDDIWYNRNWDEHNPRRWSIGSVFYDAQRYKYNYGQSKQFFVFIYVGDNFPVLAKYKEILPILKKYKLSKVYVARGEYIFCYYFKRGVLFHSEICREKNTDRKMISIKRLFKLLKIKNRNC